MSTRTGAEAEIALAVREAVVEALVGVRLAEDGQSRMLLLNMIGDYLGHPLPVSDQNVGRVHLVEIVSACASVDGGMDALDWAVRTMWPRSSVYERIRQLVREPQVRDLVPALELELLREHLTETAIPQLPALVCQAAGRAVAPASFGGNAWDALGYLTDFNAGPDGLPPVMLFVELVACQVGGVVGEILVQWNDDQAHRLGLAPELRRRRARVERVPEDARLHLLIAVQHDGIDSDRCLLSYWRQDDPQEWPPPLGGTATVLVSELERRVDALVVDAERAWSDYPTAVGLEIMLPRALLDLPVHSWRKEIDTGDPRPLVLDYPIVIRSLERMKSKHWHRVWRRRWRSLVNDPSPARIHFGGSITASERNEIDAILSDTRWVMMVLAASPTSEPKPGSDELTAALRSGLPALMWHPVSSSDDLRETIGRLLDGGLVDVPGRVQALRRSAFYERSADLDIARDLVLLWDDPDRLVVLDQRSTGR
jgi:hypothetical protein